MLLFSFLMCVTWHKRESTITMMQELYKDMNSKEVSSVFYIFYCTTLIVNLFFYPFGFYSLLKKNAKLVKVYTQMVLFYSVITIFMIYINM